MNLAMNVLATFISSFLLGRKRGTNEKIQDNVYSAFLELNFKPEILIGSSKLSNN